ncbi:MAG: dihydropteroate synthase [Gemmatimonadota bacterium]
MTGPAWRVRGGVIPLEHPVVMGILNVTPDSFSDGGELDELDRLLFRADAMVEEGASILDLGGESTRPGARVVSEEEELRRVVPMVAALAARFAVPISVDTRKARVADEALSAGAAIVNDVSALSFDPVMTRVVSESGAGVVLMHMRGTPEDMKERAHYEDVEGEVARELEVAAKKALRGGVTPEAIVLDPGIGFAKTTPQSLRVLSRLSRIAGLGFPVLVGPSRKSFLGELLGLPPRERAVGSAAACVMAFLRGARIFRVHDVAPTFQALRVAEAIAGAGDGEDWTGASTGELRATT